MSGSKSYWRQPSNSDQLASLELPGGYEYGSPGNQVHSPSHFNKEPNLKPKTSRQASDSKKSTPRGSADAEFEEDDEWNGSSDEDAKMKGRKKGGKDDKLVKRRDQNRVSQRAFRQRKERHTKELEAKVEELGNLLETASHENNIVHSQMGRMEEELCYYRRLLFAGAQQNRVLLSPSSSGTAGTIGYTGNDQQLKGSRYSTTGLSSNNFGNLPPNQMLTPYLVSYRSASAAGSEASIPRPQSTENAHSYFGTHRYTPPSMDECSTMNQTPARSCSPSSESLTPFISANSSPNSPVITSPLPNHPISSSGTSVGGAFWELDISGWNATDEALPIVDRGQVVPGYLQYMSEDSAGWSG